MIAIDLNIFGTLDDLSVTPLPHPFEAVTKKAKPAERGERMTLIRPLVRAIVTFCRAMLHPDEAKTGPLALGFNSASNANDEEACYVEFRDPEFNDVPILTIYDPGARALSGALYNTATARTAPYKIGTANEKEPDGTAAWLALLPYLEAHVGEISSAISAYMDDEENVMRYPEDFCELYLYTACSAALDYLVKNEQAKIDLDHNTLRQIKAYDITQKKVGPAMGKIQVGVFHVLKPLSGKAGVYNVESYDLSKYNLPFVKTALTAEEQLLVPSIPADNVTPVEAVQILDEMTATWGNPAATKVTQVLLEGCSGSGKSYIARLIAAVLKRPYISFTCSPNTDESDIKGALLPVASDEELAELSDEDAALVRAIYESSEETLYDTVAGILHLPNSTECLIAPDSAYEQLTGVYDSACDAQKAYATLGNLVMGKIREVMKKVQAVSGGSVRYKYIPSPIVRAVKNGWVLELQEPSCMIQQGMLSCLFDVLDKESLGILNTVNGDIVRHPDFLCITTTNRKYKGTKPLNEAARSRFQYFAKMENPSREVVMARVAKKVGITDAELCAQIAEVYKRLDECATEINAAGAVTLRGLYSFADAVKRGVNLRFALQHYLLYAITTDDEELAELEQAVEDCALMRLGA